MPVKPVAKMTSPPTVAVVRKVGRRRPAFEETNFWIWVTNEAILE